MRPPRPAGRAECHAVRSLHDPLLHALLGVAALDLDALDPLGVQRLVLNALGLLGERLHGPAAADLDALDPLGDRSH